jgi:hypothetical protein
VCGAPAPKTAVTRERMSPPAALVAAVSILLRFTALLCGARFRESEGDGDRDPIDSNAIPARSLDWKLATT